MKCSWQTFLSPLKGQCQYHALIGLSQTTRSTGGFDFYNISKIEYLGHNDGEGLIRAFQKNLNISYKIPKIIGNAT